jgi:signal transduction histidine kinase
VRDILRGLAHSKRLHVETNVAPELGLVTADPARLKQILYNYLSNAIKFTPDGGRVSVSVEASGPDLYRIDVADTGIGISRENLSKLFVEFKQLDAGASKKYQGTGLGLALTKRIIEAQGGRVDVQSTPGKGSTFSAILPRVPSKAPQRSAAPEATGVDDEAFSVLDGVPASLELGGDRHGG